MKLVFRILLVAATLTVALAAKKPQPIKGPRLETAPIEGIGPRDLYDSFHQRHSGHPHQAIDIMEPRGTPIHAVVDGTIVKLMLNRLGGITVYQFDKDGKFCYYYAHLDRYAEDIQEGMQVASGAVIGFVGSTGNATATAPHLHFAISRLSPQKKWWKGTPIDPYPILQRMLRLISAAPRQ